MRTRAANAIFLSIVSSGLFVYQTWFIYLFSLYCLVERERVREYGMTGTGRGQRFHVSSPKASAMLIYHQEHSLISASSRFDASSDTSVSNESDMTKSSLLFPRAPWWAVSAAPAGCSAWNEAAVESLIETVAADRQIAALDRFVMGPWGSRRDYLCNAVFPGAFFEGSLLCFLLIIFVLLQVTVFSEF